MINGPIPISADGEPIMGKAPGLDNFFVSCGFTSGIAAAGGAGEAMANWILEGDPGFLGEHGLHLDRTRYAVILEHTDFRLRAYFEAGEASVTSADRRTATTPTAVPRKQAMAASVEEALILLAQFLADETPKC